MEVDLRVCKRHCHELEHLLHAWVHAAQIGEAHRRRRVFLRRATRADGGATAFGALIAARRSRLAFTLRASGRWWDWRPFYSSESRRRRNWWIGRTRRRFVRGCRCWRRWGRCRCGTGTGTGGWHRLLRCGCGIQVDFLPLPKTLHRFVESIRSLADVL
jgi:hypothetical protein